MSTPGLDPGTPGRQATYLRSIRRAGHLAAGWLSTRGKPWRAGPTRPSALVSSAMTSTTREGITRDGSSREANMRAHGLTAALAFCSLGVAGCSPGTMVRCALTDLMTPEPGPQPADTRAVAAAAETTPVPDACDAAGRPRRLGRRIGPRGEPDRRHQQAARPRRVRARRCGRFDERRRARQQRRFAGRRGRRRRGHDRGRGHQPHHLDDRRPRARSRQRSSHPAARRPHLAGLRRGPVRPLPVSQRDERRPVRLRKRPGRRGRAVATGPPATPV